VTARARTVSALAALLIAPWRISAARTGLLVDMLEELAPQLVAEPDMALRYHAEALAAAFRAEDTVALRRAEDDGRAWLADFFAKRAAPQEGPAHG
jgi:hypothetical protein